MSDITLTPRLEAVAPAEYAAHRDELQAAEARGWTFRSGTDSSSVFVAEQKTRWNGQSFDRRLYDPDLGSLLARVVPKTTSLPSTS